MRRYEIEFYTEAIDEKEMMTVIADTMDIDGDLGVVVFQQSNLLLQDAKVAMAQLCEVKSVTSCEYVSADVSQIIEEFSV